MDGYKHGVFLAYNKLGHPFQCIQTLKTHIHVEAEKFKSVTEYFIGEKVRKISKTYKKEAADILLYTTISQTLRVYKFFKILSL